MCPAKSFPISYFQRYDESDDTIFYAHPRLTVHIDQAAIAALQRYLLHELPFHATMLDLMSSYRSHLPPALPVEHLVGLGLNAEEMRQNLQLDEFFLHDLNSEPTLPFDDASFDAVLCTVSVQYMTQPVRVFAEVGRVLRPGGPFIVSFSNRCFPSKAVHVWLSSSEDQHGELVQMYFDYTNCFCDVELHNISPCRLWGDRLYVVQGRRREHSQ